MREPVAWTLVGALAIATAMAWLSAPAPSLRGPEAPTVRFALAAPDTTRIHSGNQPAFDVSPDGRRLVLVAVDADGRRHLWVRPLDSLAWQKLAGTEDAIDPFWSPDSAEIGFFTPDKLKRVSVSGGTVRTVCDALEAIGGAWSVDGTTLLTLSSGVHPVAAGGGVPVPMPVGTDFWPQFLPDGDHFLSFKAIGDSPGIYSARFVQKTGISWSPALSSLRRLISRSER